MKVGGLYRRPEAGDEAPTGDGGEPDPLLDSVRRPGYLAVMCTVALTTLEGQASEYVHLAERGETVLITDQDRVIAELAPHRKARNLLADNPALAEKKRLENLEKDRPDR
jgi:antitoxin (DNA-binding transcriptional repressor) of toxin-antitoxin stability system